MKKIIEYIRLSEWIHLVGISLISSLLFAPSLSWNIVRKIIMLIFFAAIIFLSIFLMNRYYDSIILREKARSLDKNLALIFFFLGTFGCFIFINLQVFLISIVGFFICLIYIHPKFILKNNPMAAAILYLLGGILICFASGSLFVLNIKSLLLGIYFGFLLIGGNLIHEIRDYDEDKKSGFKTCPIRIGKKKTYFLSFIFFTISHLYILFLGLIKYIPLFLSILLFSGYLFYSFFYLKTYKKGINSRNILKFQKQYRLIYALIGVLSFVLLLTFKL